MTGKEKIETTVGKPDSAAKPSRDWEAIKAKRIAAVQERGARVLQLKSPLGATFFDILRQFDLAYLHLKAGLGEMGGISHQEGAALMKEAQELVLAFSDFTAGLSQKIRFRYYVPREIEEYIRPGLPPAEE